MDNIDARVSDSIEYITIKAGSYEEIKKLLHQPTSFSWRTWGNRKLLEYAVQKQDTQIFSYLNNHREDWAKAISSLKGLEFDEWMLIQGVDAEDCSFFQHCLDIKFILSVNCYAHVADHVLKTKNTKLFKIFLKHSKIFPWLNTMEPLINAWLEQDDIVLSHFLQNHQTVFEGMKNHISTLKDKLKITEYLFTSVCKELKSIQTWEAVAHHWVFHSIQIGDMKTAVFVIGLGMDVNQIDDGNDTLLLYAAQLHQYEVVEALLNQKAHLNHRNKFGYNALGLAFRDIASALPLHVIKTVDILTQRGIEQNPLEMPSVGLYANKELRYFSVYQAEALAAKVYYRHLKANFFREAKDQNLLTPEQAAKLRN